MTTCHKVNILPPPPCPAPPPRLSIPPPWVGGHRLQKFQKKSHQYHIAQDHNCETSLSELMYTSFFSTHCTPQTSENVPFETARPCSHPDPSSHGTMDQG